GHYIRYHPPRKTPAGSIPRSLSRRPATTAPFLGRRALRRHTHLLRLPRRLPRTLLPAPRPPRSRRNFPRTTRIRPEDFRDANACRPNRNGTRRRRECPAP